MNEWVSKDQIRAVTGCRATGWQIERWHKAGLLPRPSQGPGRGRGRGRASFYPPETIPMILRLLELKETTRDVREWRWRLWVEGYPIDLKPLRDDLMRALAITTMDEFDLAGSNPRRDPLLQYIYRRIGRKPDDLESLGYFLHDLLWGDRIRKWDDKLDDDTPVTYGSLFTRATGLLKDWVNADLFDTWPDLERMQAAIEQANDDEWERLRRDWQAIDSVKPVFRAVASKVVPPSLCKLVRLGYNDWMVRAAVSAVLLYVYRNQQLSEQCAKVFDRLRHLADEAAVLTNDSTKPPRRWQPSGGVAQGKEPSPCARSVPPLPSPQTTASPS